jgi:GT2 family glycosyltransferase
MNGAESVSVVIPVYNAAEELDRCLASVNSTVPNSTEVVVIDDASPDPSVAAVLRRWREKTPASWKFIANPENRGFVGTANRGMQLTQNDVVLLNSDTEATPGGVFPSSAAVHGTP